MSEHDTFDDIVAEQQLQFRALPKPLSFHLTEELIERAFAPESKKERDDGR